jgi:hypothetical protein
LARDGVMMTSGSCRWIIFFYAAVSEYKVVLEICSIQLIQVEMECWVDYGIRNEEFLLKQQHFNHPKYLTASIDVFVM